MATLLVINDDPVQLHLLASLLEQDHEQVVRFSCSRSAWDWLQHEERPDGIVLDLHMPGINGWRFCELLHTESQPGLRIPPVLLVSATYSGMDAEELVSDIGASAFLALPAEPSTIRKHVRQLLENPSPTKGFLAWVVSSNDQEIHRVRPVFTSRGWQVCHWHSGTQMVQAVTNDLPDIIMIEHPLSDMKTDELLVLCRREWPEAMCIIIGSQDSAHAPSLPERPDVYVPRGCDVQNLLSLCEKWRWERALNRVEHLLEIRTSDLKESEAQFRGLFEILPDILVIYDGEGVIRHINTGGAQQLGYQAVELIGTSFVGIQSHLLRQSDISRINDKEEAECSQWTETVLRTKDGSNLSIEQMERVVRFQGQTQRLFVGRDMTARRRMAEENTKLEQQLRQVQKMEAVGRLASGVAHDMNNILTAILAHAGLLKARGDIDNPSWKAGDVIEKAVHRGKELTSQLLGFARQGKHHHIPVDMHSVIQEVTELLSRTVNKAINLQTDFQAEESWVLGDPNQLFQVLMNLAVNASDAMRQKGDLVFCSSNEQVSAEQAATVPGLEAGEYVVIRVTDTGEGMSQEVQAHIFEPFYTTKEHGKGSGMGLAMVYGIVKNHHGYIGITSTLGVGTTIRVYLPSVPCAVPQNSTDSVPIPSGGTGHVLIVDDEEAVAEAAQAILEFLGYTTTIRLGGDKALCYVQDPSHHIDLVLLDMVMPDMSGAECFAELRRIRPESKVLLCTGYDKNHAVQDLLDQGVMGFIQKPYDLDELARICSEAVNQPAPVEICLSRGKP